MSSTIGYCYSCKWCDGIVVILPNGHKNLAPGTVAHSKPDSSIGIPNSIPCREYNRRSAEEVAEAYKYETPMESCDSLEPILG